MSELYGKGAVYMVRMTHCIAGDVLLLNEDISS